MKNNKVEIEEKKKDSKEIEKNTKQAQRDIFLEYAPYLIIIFFVIIIRSFIATPVSVKGSSMYPTLENGDNVLLYKLTKHNNRGLRRFDIVIINTKSGRLIKRIIGLPGDVVTYKIEQDEDGLDIGVLYINNKVVEEEFIDEAAKLATCNEGWSLCKSEIIVPEGEYFVLGDNRGDSKDSRMIGTVTFESIEGTTRVRLFPFNKFGNIDK